MPARNPISLLKQIRSCIILFLIGVLFLTSSAFVMPQAQMTNPFAKQLPAGGQRSPGPQADTTEKILIGSNIIQDPSFEASYNSGAYWGQYSDNFGTPLCVTADCGNGVGTAGPRTGAVWAWFGGVDFTDPDAINPEVSYLNQPVTIPSCGATLKFYFWIGRADPGSGADDFFTVRLNGAQLFGANATQKNSYPAYTLVSVNLPPGTYTPGSNLLFGSVVSDQLVTFNLDDVALIPNCLIISGNAGIEEVTINYTGGSLTTPSYTGEYSFEVPVGWSGTVTPSKSGYSFSPASRTYTSITSYQTGQNYTATPILYSISGNTGVADVSLQYITFPTGPEFAFSQPNGDYLLKVKEHWSGTVTPAHPCFTFNPVDRSYGNVVADHTLQNYTPSFNAGSGCADINAQVGGVNRGRFGLLPGASTRASFAGVNNGPVKIISTNAVPLLGAERLIYRVSGKNTSFTEMMALPNSQLDNTYWLPWYNNVDLDTQLRIGNVSGATATVHIFIGPSEVTPLEGITLPAGGSTRVSYAGVNNGPVKIVSNQNIVAAERLIYKVAGVNASFSEMMALPDSQLDTTYWLPWYNNVDLDTQLRFANVSGSTAQVRVYIGSAEMPNSPFTLLPGESTRQSFAGINNGPVKIVSNVPIVAAERLIYRVGGKNTSFTEMMALPNSQLDDTYWLPWYNNVDLDTQLRFANIGIATATVRVYIGGAEMEGSPFTLGAGASTRVSFAGINSGPVQIVSNVNIVAAERLIYKVSGVNTSFSEMMALPNSALDTIYWLPWYNNVDLDTQLRFGVP